MSTSLENHAAAIREAITRVGPPTDPTTLHRYALIAARWAQLRLLADRGNSTPDDDRTFRDLTPLLRVLTEQIGLDNVATDAHHGPDAVVGITDWCGHLPTDLGCLLGQSWQESVEDW